VFVQICFVQLTALAVANASSDKRVARISPDRDVNASMRQINLWDVPILSFWMESICEMEMA